MSGPLATPPERTSSTDRDGADRTATELRGFGGPGLLAILAILVVGALSTALAGLLILVWAWRSRTPWSEIGYVRPRSWLVDLVVGIASGVAFKLAMKAVVMPLLGADPVNRAYHFLVGNPEAIPGIVLAVLLNAGFGEETLYRGWMFERMGKLLGRGAGAKTLIVLVTSALFAAAHYPGQGWFGVQQAAVTGLAFGGFFAISGRLWPLIFAHVAFDLTAVAIIYWDLETAIARSIFK